MKIGIVDAMGYCLQERLLREGHELFIFVPGESKVDGDFNVTTYRKGKVTQVISMDALIEAKCDFYIAMNEHDDQNCFAVLRQLGIPVLGYSPNAELLEKDRKFAKRICEMYKLTDIIRMPDNHSFTDIPSLKKFLKKNKKPWVFKQTAESPQDESTNRTIVSLDHEQTLGLLNGKNAWFDDKGVGGVLLEEYIDGMEVAFGAWFDGSKFLLPYYGYTEHKGAQNQDRGFVQTGEVGSSVFFYHDAKEDNKITQLFRKLEPFLQYKVNGMVDLNCMMNPKTGELTLLEFTMRFGRPTLEFQLAAMEDVKVGKLLKELATQSHDEYIFLDAYARYKYTLVSVFHYGYPWVDEEKVVRIPFKYPKIPKGVNAVIEQSFCQWDDTYKSLVTGSDRHFAVIGRGHTTVESRMNAYQVLKDYKLLGSTWRDDVGHRFAECLELTEKHYELDAEENTAETKNFKWPL